MLVSYQAGIHRHTDVKISSYIGRWAADQNMTLRRRDLYDVIVPTKNRRFHDVIELRLSDVSERRLHDVERS